VSASPSAAPKPAAAPVPTVAPGASVTVQVGYLNSASDAGILIALAKGYFQAQGLDVQLQRFDTGAAMTPPLSTGQLDVGAGSPSAGLYNAAARNITVKIVADKGSDRPGFGYQGIALRKGLQDRVKDYADLKGLKIGMTGTGGISPEIVLDVALKKGGLTMKDVETVAIPYPDLNTALNTGAIDAAVHFEPLFTVGINQGFAVSWKRADEIYPNHQSATILYGSSFVENKPDVARRWMLAYVQGVRYYNDAFLKGQNRDEVIGILAQATGASAQVLSASVPVGLNPDGYVNAQGLADDVQTLRELGYIDQPFDVSTIVDNSYVDSAVNQLGPYR
jgi:NitT/TauT family transport system substrate-binding protein